MMYKQEGGSFSGACRWVDLCSHMRPSLEQPCVYTANNVNSAARMREGCLHCHGRHALGPFSLHVIALSVCFKVTLANKEACAALRDRDSLA